MTWLQGSLTVLLGMIRREVVTVNLDSLVKQGRLPWRPNAQSKDLEVFHQYEIPLTGIFWMGQAAVLFTMAFEGDGDLSVWSYVELDEEVAAGLPALTFESLEMLDDWVDSQFLGREAVFAIVREDRIGSRWTRIHVESGLLEATDAFLTAVIQSLDQVEDTASRIRAKIAGLDAARSELPDSPELLKI
ncbi:hypothetical protein [Streptosporangium sp. NPDC000396]|uniref:hypothetical protein n=1 Tax=Streptosporangium sp. NPDC000396 TaxID=3366185 RepID=UPI00369DC657